MFTQEELNCSVSHFAVSHTAVQKSVVDTVGSVVLVPHEASIIVATVIKTAVVIKISIIQT